MSGSSGIKAEDKGRPLGGKGRECELSWQKSPILPKPVSLARYGNSVGSQAIAGTVAPVRPCCSLRAPPILAVLFHLLELLALFRGQDGRNLRVSVAQSLPDFFDAFAVRSLNFAGAAI